MNDWEIKRFLKFVIFLQVLLWLSIGLELIGLNTNLLRPILALIFILLINGVLILRILRIHRIGSIKTLLYSVGLSL